MTPIFCNFTIILQVVISGLYDYSSPEVQEGLLRLLSQLENTTFIDPFYTESWLRDFLDYVRRNQDYTPIDISNEALFIQALNSVSRFFPRFYSILDTTQGQRIHDTFRKFKTFKMP